MSQQEFSTNGIDHIGLTASDLDQSLKFFTECLGWQQFGGRKDYPAAYVTDGRCKVTLWQASQPHRSFDRHGHVGLHHIAFALDSRSELNAAFRRIADWPGVTVEFPPQPSRGGPKIHFMIFEPGGNRVEFAFDPR